MDGNTATFFIVKFSGFCTQLKTNKISGVRGGKHIKGTYVCCSGNLSPRGRIWIVQIYPRTKHFRYRVKIRVLCSGWL